MRRCCAHCRTSPGPTGYCSAPITLIFPDAVADAETAGTDGYEGFDEAARAMMEHENARRLFPRLAEG